MFLIVLHLEEVNSYLKMSVFNVLFLRRCQHSGANLNGGGEIRCWGVFCADGTRSLYMKPPYIYIYLYLQRDPFICRED